jgi:MarR family transcriptional regulator for hemolysin
MSDHSDSPRARFGIRFSLLARRWRRALDARLAAEGLSEATWAPLVHLKEVGGGITQKDLAALLGVDGSSLVRVIDILVREGFVERRVDENDGRARRIFLTEAGEKRVGEIRAVLTSSEEILLRDVSDADLGAMMEHFDRIERRLNALQKEPQR